MSKPRLFYLDSVRAFATIVILLTHYNAIYLYAGIPEKAVISTTVCNLYIGDFGVSLFLIISGASLMYVYEEKLDLKTFYKKRFLNIFPMFWIAYVIAFLLYFYRNGNIGAAPKRNIIFSILGMDSYLAELGMQTFVRVGLWFLGFIIIVYLFFPLLRKGVNDYCKITIVIVGILYICSVLFLKNYCNPTIILTTRLPEIVFGMIFVKYIKNVNPYVAILSLGVCIANTVLKPTFSSNIQTTYVGIAAFLVLVFIAKYVKWKAVKNICSVICKYSYPCFIVHFQILHRVTSHFDIYALTKNQSILVFLIGSCVVAVASWLLYHVEQKVRLLFTS